MNKLYLVNGVYMVSKAHSNILIKKEFINQMSLPETRTQAQIRAIKNKCLEL